MELLIADFLRLLVSNTSLPEARRAAARETLRLVAPHMRVTVGELDPPYGEGLAC